jgi:hypothetical protein
MNDSDLFSSYNSEVDKFTKSSYELSSPEGKELHDIFHKAHSIPESSLPIPLQQQRDIILEKILLKVEGII